MRRCMYVAMMMLVAGVTQAGQWYTGADVAYIEYEFTPMYSFVSGREDAGFVNEESGYEVSLLGGYMQEVCSYFSVGFQGCVSVNDVEWSLNLSDPASFSYEQPYTWGLSVVPKFKLCEKSALVLEAGLLQGIIKEHKYGSLETNYDVDETVGGTLFGVGLSYKLTDNVDIMVKYQRKDFSSFAYKTTSPEGEHVETVWDDPSAESWRLGAVYNF